MSATINAKKIKFHVLGNGFDNVRNDSGNGESAGAMFYDKDGEVYFFQLMPVRIPSAPNTSGNSGVFVSGDNYTWYWNANSNGREYINNMRVNYLDYGASMYRGLKDADRLAWDICENDIWFTPSKLNGFSIVNLIELGLLQDGISSCRLYKNQPLSNTYIEIVIDGRKPDYLKDAVGVYEDINLTAYSIEFRFVVNNINKGAIHYGVDEFDGALCELTKYDETKGLGACVQGMSRIPIYEQGGNPSVIRTGQQLQTSDNIFALLNTYFDY